jgi:two-component system, NtrC family, sensor kinase
LSLNCALDRLRRSALRRRNREVAVLFTRTIRRTMVCGLAMVLFMMIGLLVSAIYSHYSYRNIIRRFHFAFRECPQKPALAASLVNLHSPLLNDVRDTGSRDQGHMLRREQFRQAVKEAQDETDHFIQSLEDLKPGVEMDPLTQSVAKGQTVLIRQRLVELDKLSNELADPVRSQHALAAIRDEIIRLQVLAHKVPDFQRRVQQTLDEAQELNRRGLWLDIGSGAVAVLFFLGLIVYGYIWVFSPLRKLHQGALRVAQGDFNYRLQFNRQDEMKELADAFNSMTSRFQEIRGDLDRQVCERIKQLIRSERLAGIGFLAAGVAHEINNPLSAIAMAAESLVERETALNGTDPTETEIARQYLHMIDREAGRCQRITRKLLDFARGNGDTCAFHDLTTIVNDVLGVVRHLSRYSDRTVHFTRSAPCVLEINGPEIQQVVMNLVSNGLEAMDTGGTMSIEIIEQADQVTLAVTDDGCGMTPPVIENLFEPFFTQRRDGQGTGLGLSISHRIVTDHGGSIEVASRGPGYGSTFRVKLPRRAAQREAAAA